MRKQLSVILSIAMSAVLLTGCNKLTSPEPLSEEVVSESAIAESSETAPAGHQYVHSEDGYYCLLDDGVEYELVTQSDGTCWICASTCAMITNYQLKHDGTIAPFSQRGLVDEIYDKDEEGGVHSSGSKYKEGGVAVFVINELSLGFGDGYVLDEAIEAKDYTMDEIKEGIQKYGALYIGIPDTQHYYISYKDGFYTLNFPDAEVDDYDHSIAILGWDDHFPKEYFNVEPSRDGAWITYNSNHPGDYYYVSYETPIDLVNDPPVFMSVSEEYSKVLSHDSGRWTASLAGEGETTTANVFRGEGTLTAVGTFIPSKNTDLTIQIMTPDFGKVLYSQECHADEAGYRVFTLDTPIEVDSCAVAVTYPDGAPVEGESQDIGFAVIDVKSNEGESFIRSGDKWLDLSKESTWEKLGFTANNACIRALYGKE